MDGDSPLRENTLFRTDKGTKLIYALLFVINLGIFVAGVILNDLTDVILSVPIMIVILATLVYDSEFIHVPPVLLIFVNAAMIISLILYLSAVSATMSVPPTIGTLEMEECCRAGSSSRIRCS